MKFLVTFLVGLSAVAFSAGAPQVCGQLLCARTTIQILDYPGQSANQPWRYHDD